MILEVILVSFVIIALYYNFCIKKKIKLPPGPKGFPLIGNVLALKAHPKHTFLQWRKQWGNIFSLKFGPIDVVILSDVKLVKQCFNDPNFNGRFNGLLICYLSDGKHGILSSEGQEWTEQRRFTLRHLRDFGFGKNYMESLIMDEVNEFTQWVKTEEGNPITMQHRFELAVVNSLWFIITGKKYKQDDSQLNDLLKEMDEYFTQPTLATIVGMISPSLFKVAPTLLGLTKVKEVAHRLHEFLKQVIQEHQDTLPKDGSARDFIDAYLHEINSTNDQNSSFYREDGIRSLLAIIGDLFFAGTETTSTTLAWTIMYLAVHSDVQKKLQKEIDEVVGSSRPVSLQDKANLPYSVATIEEIFRKSSIIATGMMHLAMEDTKFCGYDIPKDTWVMPNIYSIHHDPDIWGDPQNFRPERFLEDDPNPNASANGKKMFKKNEHMLPFSLGKRNCIGEQFARDEIFLFMTNIIQKFNVSPDPSRKIPDPDEAKEGLFLKPEEFHVIMKDRLAS